MAGNEGKAAVRKSQLAVGRSKTNPKNSRKILNTTPVQRRRRGSQFFRFNEAKGKTVEFIEMGTAADFPCVEIAFDDKTALLFEMGTRITMEPAYSDWTTGNQRLLRTWPVQETS